jgi:hypothetical protein
MEVIPGEDRVGPQILGPKPGVAHPRDRPVLRLNLHPDPDRAPRRHGAEH